MRAHLARPAVHLPCQFALGPAAAHEPRAQLLVRALAGSRTVCAVAAHWNAPIHLIACHANPYQNAASHGRSSGVLTPSNWKPGCLRHTRARERPRGSSTESNPTITRPVRAIQETPPFATPSNELATRRTRFT
ncbi:hypothetical protein BN2537_5345 [Streptomyces venezuelae]|nr:hypothetical protein BN2537_5345 [Streptomyces venezuelae]